MLQNIQGEKMEEMKVLNIYKFNIYQILTFMFKIKRDAAPAVFQNNSWERYHRYTTGFSQSNFVEGNILSNQTKFAVLSRGPRFWDRILNQEQKNMAYINGFENSVKTSLLYLENEIIYFWIWRRKFKNKNSGQKLTVIILYIVYYLTHTAWRVTLSPTDFFVNVNKYATFCVFDHIC